MCSSRCRKRHFMVLALSAIFPMTPDFRLDMDAFLLYNCIKSLMLNN